MKKLTRHLRFFFLIIGAVLLMLLIRKVGVNTIVDNIRALGWRFAPILCISGLGYVSYTIAWMIFLNRLSDGIGFFELFRIKISGETVNTLTPANFIGGDPMRIYLLKKNFPVSEGAASVVVDRTLQSIAILVTILLGIIVAFLKFDELSANITYGVPIVLVIACGFMGFLLVHQRRGLFGLLLNFCKRIGIKKEFSERTVKRIMELDSHIVDFYNQNHRGFLVALACHIFGRLLGVVEIYAIGRVVSDEFSIFAALMLAALAPMVMAVFAFIPGAFGVMEGAFSGVLYLLHLDPSIGITIQIAKRLRAAFWISLGLLFMGAHDRRKVFDDKGMIEQVEEIGTV
ncbi:MAG: lysylphosphatidylglycerol synthase transmembrane domain-containing protein [Pseudomonadota bacterium]